MKPAFVFLVFAAFLGSVARAEERFTQALSHEDFVAAGLDKLTPEERARLDELIARKKNADVAQAKVEATKDARAKLRTVQVAPGTVITYETLESRLLGTFHGWNAHTVFVLENGQHWQVANGDEYYGPAIKDPHVVITPASLSGFWLEVVEAKARVRVRPVPVK